MPPATRARAPRRGPSRAGPHSRAAPGQRPSFGNRDLRVRRRHLLRRHGRPTRHEHARDQQARHEGGPEGHHRLTAGWRRTQRASPSARWKSAARKRRTKRQRLPPRRRESMRHPMSRPASVATRPASPVAIRCRRRMPAARKDRRQDRSETGPIAAGVGTTMAVADGEVGVSREQAPSTSANTAICTSPHLFIATSARCPPPMIGG